MYQQRSLLKKWVRKIQKYSSQNKEKYETFSHTQKRGEEENFVLFGDMR